MMASNDNYTRKTNTWKTKTKYDEHSSNKKKPRIREQRQKFMFQAPAYTPRRPPNSSSSLHIQKHTQRNRFFFWSSSHVFYHWRLPLHLGCHGHQSRLQNDLYCVMVAKPAKIEIAKVITELLHAVWDWRCPYQTVKKMWQYIHSFKHSTGIGWTDRCADEWTEMVKQIALCMHCVLMHNKKKLDCSFATENW